MSQWLVQIRDYADRTCMDLAHQSENLETHKIYHYYQLTLSKENIKENTLNTRVLSYYIIFLQLIAQYSVLNKLWHKDTIMSLC